jgi:hypothetical protein
MNNNNNNNMNGDAPNFMQMQQQQQRMHMMQQMWMQQQMAAGQQGNMGVRNLISSPNVNEIYPFLVHTREAHHSRGISIYPKPIATPARSQTLRGAKCRG